MPAASLRRSHGRSQGLFMFWLYTYEECTPGVEVYDNTTTIMGENGEPQPDACLIIHPDKGGQMRFTNDDYLEGAAEFVGEVASSTESYDLYSRLLFFEIALHTLGTVAYTDDAPKGNTVKDYFPREIAGFDSSRSRKTSDVPPSMPEFLRIRLPNASQR